MSHSNGKVKIQSFIHIVLYNAHHFSPQLFRNMYGIHIVSEHWQLHITQFFEPNPPPFYRYTQYETQYPTFYNKNFSPHLKYLYMCRINGNTGRKCTQKFDPKPEFVVNYKSWSILFVIFISIIFYKMFSNHIIMPRYAYYYYYTNVCMYERYMLQPLPYYIYVPQCIYEYSPKYNTLLYIYF